MFAKVALVEHIHVVTDHGSLAWEYCWQEKNGLALFHSLRLSARSPRPQAIPQSAAVRICLCLRIVGHSPAPRG